MFVRTLYKIINTTNQKMYIGQSADPEFRIREHLTGRGSVLVWRAVQKYGIENFVWAYIEQTVCLDQCNLREIELIEFHNTLSPFGYNLDCGGNVKLPSEESREKNRQSHLGKPSPTKGLTFSDDAKNKMSKAKKGIVIGEKNTMWGKKHKPETIELFSKINSGEKNPMYGKKILNRKLSDEQKQKIGESVSGERNGFARGNSGWWTLQLKKYTREEILTKYPDLQETEYASS